MFLAKLSSNTNKFSLEYDNYFPMGIGNVEIYERIMIWNIATDLCFYTDSGSNEPINKLRREVSKDVSDYMMYIIVMYVGYVLKFKSMIFCCKAQAHALEFSLAGGGIFGSKQNPQSSHISL